jgi:hypothetical protein
MSKIPRPVVPPINVIAAIAGASVDSVLVSTIHGIIGTDAPIAAPLTNDAAKKSSINHKRRAPSGWSGVGDTFEYGGDRSKTSRDKVGWGTLPINILQ